MNSDPNISSNSDLNNINGIDPNNKAATNIKQKENDGFVKLAMRNMVKKGVHLYFISHLRSLE